MARGVPADSVEVEPSGAGLRQARERAAQSRYGSGGPGERDDLEPDCPVAVPDRMEGLFTPFWVAWQGPISEPEPVRLSRHIDDPAGSDDEQQPQPDRGDDLSPDGDEGLGGIDGRSGASVSLPSPHSFLALAQTSAPSPSSVDTRS